MSGRIQAVERSIDILMTLAGGPQTLTEITRATGLAKRRLDLGGCQARAGGAARLHRRDRRPARRHRFGAHLNR